MSAPSASPPTLTQSGHGVTVSNPQDPVVDRVTETLDQLQTTLDQAPGICPADHPSDASQGNGACPLTIIVPVFNERLSLPKVLQRIDEVMPGGTQTLVVDDASTDGTAEWLMSLPERPDRTIVFRRCNHGKGSAVRLGIRRSAGAVVAIQDADTEYDPIDLLRVIEPIQAGEAEAVYGSRYLDGSDDPSLLHQLGNWALTTASNCMTGQRLTDMETCHKAFRGNLIRSIEIRECRFGFEPEITGKLSARGVTIEEVPTGYQYRSYEEGKKITWVDGLAAFACMWRYRNASWLKRTVQAVTLEPATRLMRKYGFRRNR